MGTIICGSCGTENPDNVRFCKYCGTRLDVRSNIEGSPGAGSSEARICSKCGFVNPPGATNCEQCRINLSVVWNPEVIDAEARKNLEQQRHQKVLQNYSQDRTPPERKISSNFPLDSRYSTLRSIAALCRIIGYVFSGLGVLSGLFGAIIRLSDSFWMAIGVLIASLMGAVIVFVFWLIIAESISVILDIEENTRKTAVLLQGQQ